MRALWSAPTHDELDRERFAIQMAEAKCAIEQATQSEFDPNASAGQAADDADPIVNFASTSVASSSTLSPTATSAAAFSSAPPPALVLPSFASAAASSPSSSSSSLQPPPLLPPHLHHWQPAPFLLAAADTIALVTEATRLCRAEPSLLEIAGNAKLFGGIALFRTYINCDSSEVDSCLLSALFNMFRCCFL